MKYVSLKPPAEVQNRQTSRKVRRHKARIDPDVKEDLQGRLKKYIEAWKAGSQSLHARLRELNDHYEGITEEVSFPWTGASSVTMGVAAGMARTMRATFDRAVFGDQHPFTGKSKGNVNREERNKLETAVNWLALEHNNLVDQLRDTPVPAFRDGTVPVMGEWERRIERAVDFKTYRDPQSFQQDYPDAATAGVSDDKYVDILEMLGRVGGAVEVEYMYDEVVYDGPKFDLIPLARYVRYPMSATEQKDMVIYGRQYFESIEKARTKAKRGIYDKEAVEEAAGGASANVEDPWGYSRDQIEGTSSSHDEQKRLELYRLVLCDDLDEDRIPERYLVTCDHKGHILSMERYRLRKNIDCVVPFRFLRRDGRFLGKSLLDDGLDQFKMIDSIHRHRQNTRQITDSPTFIVPDSLKDEIDFGSEDSLWRPGITFYLPDKYIKEGEGPRQMPIQSFSRTAESVDEEQSVIRYLEFRLGPSMGLSGQESVADPRAPASKHLSQLKQATLRLDDYIREWKRSIPAILDLMNALYYQYGPDNIEYMEPQEEDEPMHREAARELFALDKVGFALKHQEVSLSPELEMEKALALAGIAGQNPILLQNKPEILLHLWNDLVLASRAPESERLRVPLPKQGSEQMQNLVDGNRLSDEDPSAPSPNQQAALGMANFQGVLNGANQG